VPHINRLQSRKREKGGEEEGEGGGRVARAWDWAVAENGPRNFNDPNGSSEKKRKKGGRKKREDTPKLIGHVR